MGNFPPVKLPDGKICTSGPNCRIHGDIHKLLSQSVAHNKKQKIVNVNPLANKTPEEIDLSLAALFKELYSFESSLALAEQNVDSYRRVVQNSGSYYQSRLDEAELKVVELKNNIENVENKIAPHEIEYQTRPWNRAFLVSAGNGHVHKSRSCSTCYSTTHFVWLPSYSGKEEQEIVSDAGESACTVCYPSAPVEILRRPTRIHDPEQLAARAQRAEEKAIREAEKVRKGIKNPDGSELRPQKYYGTVKTERTAEIEAVNYGVRLKAVSNGLFYRTDVEDEMKYENDFAMIVKALAHKRQQTEDEVKNSLEIKIDKKYRKEWGQ